MPHVARAIVVCVVHSLENQHQCRRSVPVSGGNGSGSPREPVADEVENVCDGSHLMLVRLMQPVRRMPLRSRSPARIPWRGRRHAYTCLVAGHHRVHPAIHSGLGDRDVNAAGISTPQCGAAPELLPSEGLRGEKSSRRFTSGEAHPVGAAGQSSERVRGATLIVAGRVEHQVVQAPVDVVLDLRDGLVGIRRDDQRLATARWAARRRPSPSRSGCRSSASVRRSATAVPRTRCSPAPVWDRDRRRS